MSLFGLSTSNPALTGYFWKDSSKNRTHQKMTLTGVVVKSIFCLLLVCATASITWKLYFDGIDIKWYTTGGIIVAVICGMLISVRRKWIVWLTIIYALAKGLFVGGFSAHMHHSYPNLPIQAVIFTLATFITMLLLFVFKIIKVTHKFRSIIITATTTIFTIYMIAFILSFFGISISFLTSTSWLSIAFNVITAVFASLSLLLDFDYIDKYMGKANKSYEWFATWGLLVTIIWLYVEILRLLRKLAIRF